LTYNLTPIGNSTGILELFTLVNTELMFGYFGLLILIIITGISLMGFLASTNDAGKSVAASSFIAAVMSLFLAGMGLLTGTMLVIIVLVSAISLAASSKFN